ncbi:hypothetical protein ACLIKE_08900 [Ferroplasma acidiphilum]|uniref:Uncharacterized protein n=1 Tax=Ferroplasma acidiphilum TaxID=74969 RepID=A0A7K4FP55_9ARCH|nr:hypothetical protein [Ferroplasma acidiphilum]NOL60800.1 hypothetical protein [Ferroplasma acidiphilum]
MMVSTTLFSLAFGDQSSSVSENEATEINLLAFETISRLSAVHKGDMYPFLPNESSIIYLI